MTDGSRRRLAALASLPSSVGSTDQRSNIGDRECAQALWHKPDNVRAKLSAFIPQAKRDGVVAGRPMAAVVAVRAKHGYEIRKRLANNSSCVRQLTVQRFSVLVSHSGQSHITA
jgi:hypothetical protein